jgi:hypothetical protein
MNFPSDRPISWGAGVAGSTGDAGKISVDGSSGAPTQAMLTHATWLHITCKPPRPQRFPDP